MAVGLTLTAMTLKSNLTGSTALFRATTSLHLQARGPMVTFAPDFGGGEGGGGEAPDDGGALSVSDALSLLDEEPDGEDGDPPAEQKSNTKDPADDQTADIEDAPDDDDPASEDDENEDDDDQAQAIDAPEFWSAEEKALFAQASPDVQMLVAAKTAEAEKRVYAAKEEAAAARKDASIIGQVREQIDQQLGRVETIFQGKWDGVDWAAWSRENPTEAFQAKLEYEQEQEELDRLRTAAAATEAEEHRQFVRDQGAILAEAKHPLADPVKGKDAKKALVEYAKANGYTQDDLRWAGAKELTTLHKAFLFDQAQKNLATKPPKQPSTEGRKPGSVRPAGPPPSRRETQAKRLQSVRGRAFGSGKLNDAVALLDALED